MKKSIPLLTLGALIIAVVVLAVNVYAIINSTPKASEVEANIQKASPLPVDFLNDPELGALLNKDKNGDVPVVINPGDLQGN